MLRACVRREASKAASESGQFQKIREWGKIITAAHDTKDTELLQWAEDTLREQNIELYGVLQPRIERVKKSLTENPHQS
jgi:hypothetical protein